MNLLSYPEPNKLQLLSWSFIMEKWILLFFCIISNSFAQAVSCSDHVDSLTGKQNVADSAPLDRAFLIQEITDIIHEQIQQLPSEIFNTSFIDSKKRLQKLSRILKKNINSYSEERVLQLQADLADPNRRSQTALEELKQAIKKWRSRRRTRIALGTATGVIAIPPTTLYLYVELTLFLANALAP